MAGKPEVTVDMSSKKDSDEAQNEAPEAPEAPAEEPKEEPKGEPKDKESELWEGIAEDHPVREYVKSLRDENAEKRVTSKSVREENEALKQRLSEAKTEEDVESAISHWRAQVEEKETELLRERVANRHKLPEELREFLSATDEEALEEQAKKLVPKGSSTPAPQPGEHLSGGLNPRENSNSASDFAASIRKKRGKRRR